jgi:hypothetical protein
MTFAVLMFGAIAHLSAVGLLGGLYDYLGPSYSYDGPPAPQLLSSRASKVGSGTADVTSLFYWNEVMTDANAIDHTPAVEGENRVFGEQIGPARTALAFAIVHIAVFDAVNAIVGGYQSYTGIDAAPYGASVRAAIAKAARYARGAVPLTEGEVRLGAGERSQLDTGRRLEIEWH